MRSTFILPWSWLPCIRAAENILKSRMAGFRSLFHLESDFSDCFRQIFQCVFVLKQQRFDQVEIFSDPGKTFIAFSCDACQLCSELRLVLNELRLILNEL